MGRNQIYKLQTHQELCNKNVTKMEHLLCFPYVSNKTGRKRHAEIPTLSFFPKPWAMDASDLKTSSQCAERDTARTPDHFQTRGNLRSSVQGGQIVIWNLSNRGGLQHM